MLTRDKSDIANFFYVIDYRVNELQKIRIIDESSY